MFAFHFVLFINFRWYKSFIFIILSFLLIFYSCGNRKFEKLNKKIESDNPNLVHYSQKENLISSNNLDTSILIIDYQMYKNCDSLYKDSIQYEIYFYLKSIFPFNSTLLYRPSEINNVFMKYYLNQFKKSFINIYDSLTYKFLYDLNIDIKIIDEVESPYAFLFFKSKVFTGNNLNSNFCNSVAFNKSLVKKINFNEIFTSDSLNSTLINNYIRNKYNVKKNESLKEIGFWSDDFYNIKPQTFYIQLDTVYLYFNSLEIANEKIGNIILSIPFDKFKK